MNECIDQYRGSETILLVDDDEAFLKMMSTVLLKSGYTIIDAVDGQDAVEKYTQNSDKIDLVIADVVMPGKDGIATYIEIKSINPDAKILLMSGFVSSDDDTEINIPIIPNAKLFLMNGFVPSDLNTEKNISIIPKSFTPIDVVKKIRTILDSETSI